MAPLRDGVGEITSAWTDSEGNIWYKTLETQEGQEFTVLVKISKSAAVRESVWRMPKSDQEVKNPQHPGKMRRTRTTPSTIAQKE